MAEIQKGAIPLRTEGPRPPGHNQVQRPEGPIKQVAQGAGKPVLSADRYTPKVLNEVMRSLKSLVAHLRSEKGFGRSLAIGKGEGGESAKKEELTTFEKALIARFEGGAELGTRLEEGRAKFLEKTSKVWVEFF